MRGLLRDRTYFKRLADTSSGRDGYSPTLLGSLLYPESATQSWNMDRYVSGNREQIKQNSELVFQTSFFR